ncbi:AsmA family protein [Aquiflexum lacus]|uniref:AsmA family protein n=1 Tax=Aquiflexum lacus TaxID=2483805 RepID=UPI0018939853|nr:AsmA-like C-terminal region-containing protein [Aquiflexum lacus]
MKSKKIRALLILAFSIFVVIPSVAIILLYSQQKVLTQKAIGILNEQFVGELSVKDSHIAPFTNFPYVSIDLNEIVFFEGKTTDSKIIYSVEDLYLGFSVWDIIRGKYKIKSLKVQNGNLDLVKDAEGNINLLMAKGILNENEESLDEGGIDLDLSSIQLKNVKVKFDDLSNSTTIDVDLEKADAIIKLQDEHIYIDLISDLILGYIVDSKPTFFSQKHFKLDLEFDYDQSTNELLLAPSRLYLEDALLGLEGKADLGDDIYLDIKMRGEKPDFSLLAAFLPKETAMLLKKYENEGDVFFQGSVEGFAGNGNVPKIAVEFGCDNAYFLNTGINKKVDDLRFTGFFTNGKERRLKTSEFQLLNFYAKPDQGKFQGRLIVQDFENPAVKINLNADLDLEFLGDFFEVEGLQGISGQVIVDMDFDELIDFESGVGGISNAKNSIQSELKIIDLNVSLPDYPHQIRSVNAYAFMKEGNLSLDNLSFQIADSDFHLSGTMSDLPSVLHRDSKPIKAKLEASASRIDLNQLLPSDSAINEVINDFKIKLAFESTGINLMSYEYLPHGEFFIEDFYAKLEKYPHAFHDFHADILIGEENMEVKDFSGEIDKSDFHFSGKVLNYPKWFQENPKGDSRFEIDLVSNHLNISDLLKYNGVSYLPEDYQKEEIDGLNLKGSLDLHYNDGFESADFYLTDLDGKFKVHPLKLEDFGGRIHYELDFLTVTDFGGKMGASDFKVSMGYQLGEPDSLKNKRNFFYLKSLALDLDALMGFESIDVDTNHQEAFNVFELPFSEMDFKAEIGKMNYHTFWLENVSASARTTTDHYIYLDTLGLRAADGTLGVKGYFNGSDPEHIYFYSTMEASKLDLDKLLIKFENFGQDYLINENLHGKVSGTITSKFLVYPDLTPIIEKSEAKMDLTIYQGSIVNFAPLSAMSSYFSDRNLSNVKFDTLSNTFDLKDGILNIPSMNINSSLGFIELSGKQSLDLNMDYFIRIPLGMVTSVGFKSLFGGKNKNEVDPDQEDAIVYRDEDKKVRFVNVNMKGTPDDYKISLGRDRKSN